MSILLLVATEQEIISERFINSDILISGIGMVNTTHILTEHLINNSFKYDLIINIGIAGSISSSINIGDTVEVIEDSFLELGFNDYSGFNKFKNMSLVDSFRVDPITNLRKVKAVTVNTVNSHPKYINSLPHSQRPEIESMEGAACFLVCQRFKVPCLQIRSISNQVAERNKDNWNLELAVTNLNNTVQKIINNL